MAVRGGTWQRVILAAAGIFGAMGVAAAAAGSHEGSRNLSAIASICLAHGPALLALALAGKGRALGLAAGVLAASTAVFTSDLLMREWLGHGLFPGAAPLGGAGMVAGWLLIGLGALLGASGGWRKN